MCSRKMSDRGSAHEARVHAEFVSRESTPLEKAFVRKQKREDNLARLRITAAHYRCSPARDAV